MSKLLLLSHLSCPTLCGPVDGSPPGSPFPGVLQARALEWVALSKGDTQICEAFHVLKKKVKDKSSKNDTLSE